MIPGIDNNNIEIKPVTIIINSKTNINLLID